jgi:hypothetical protein
MSTGRRWTIRDRDGHEIYLTEERWEHITEPNNHPELLDYEEELKETLRLGKRKQDSLKPQKFRYTRTFNGLAAGNTELVALVLFRFVDDEIGQTSANNYVVTAYQKATLKGM